MPLLPIVAGAPGTQFNENTNQQGHPLGSEMVFADGRRYKYALCTSVAIAAARLCAQTLNAADHDDLAVQAAAAAGQKTVTVTNGSTTAIGVDDLKDGYLSIDDDAGEGHLYTIKSNGAAATGATVTLELYENLQVALTTATTVTLFRNPYGRVIIHPSPPLTMLTGVTPMAITADNYHWQQIRGPASVLEEATTAAIIIGEYVDASDETDGAVERADHSITDGTPPTGHGETHVGVAMEVAAADGEQAIVFLTVIG